MSLALLFPWLFQISKVDRYAAFSTVFGCHLTAGELLSRMSGSVINFLKPSTITTPSVC